MILASVGAKGHIYNKVSVNQSFGIHSFTLAVSTAFGYRRYKTPSVVKAHVLYFGDPGAKSFPGEQLSALLRFPWIFHSLQAS
jgi:hypothetical protein